MNLEGHTGRVSVEDLMDLRTQFLAMMDPKDGEGMCEGWYDASIEGDGFNIVFPNNGKVFFLRCECWGED